MNFIRSEDQTLIDTIYVIPKNYRNVPYSVIPKKIQHLNFDKIMCFLFKLFKE